MLNEKINVLNELTWSEIREEVVAVNAELALIIDKISPDKHFKLIKASYSYGDYILKEGVACLPNEKGQVLPYTESCFNEKLKEALSYSSIPLFLTLKKSSEVFIDTGFRIIPLNLFNPGSLLGLFETMNMMWNQVSEPKWSVSAGARSAFILPKITEATGLKRLRNEYGLTSDMQLKFLSDHWSVFKKIANHSSFTQPWKSEAVFFTRSWFEKYKNDGAWIDFQRYLFRKAWQQATFAIGKLELSLCWGSYISAITSRNLKPNTYLTDQLKHIISIAAGMWPGFRPDDETQLVLPSREIQYAFAEVYMLKQYFPSLMHISYLLDEKNTSLPVYYSLYYPIIAEGTPYNTNSSTIMLDIKSIKLLLETAVERSQDNSSKFNQIIKNTSFDYFHVEHDKFNEIQKSAVIPDFDNAFLNKKERVGRNEDFCSTSPFWRGCVRICNNGY